MKKIILSAVLGIGFLSAATQSGEELFKAKCAVCHKMGEPKQDPNAVAPMLAGVATHLNEALKTKEERVKHIKEFVINPTKEKAICPSVKRFGLMPSQKGAVTEKELEKIAEFMAEQKGMSQASHQKIQGKGKAEMMFNVIDANGDDMISKEEFIKFKEQKGMHQGKGMQKKQGKGCNK